MRGVVDVCSLEAGRVFVLDFHFYGASKLHFLGGPRSSRFGTAGRGRISWQWDAEMVDCGVVYLFDMILFIVITLSLSLCDLRLYLKLPSPTSGN